MVLFLLKQQFQPNFHQVSLNGKVMPVGGIKEKIIAAQRSGIKCVVLPRANKRDYDDVPEFIRNDLEVHFADNYKEIYSVIFQKESNALRQVAS